jgi:hypothetical protein
MSVAQRATSSTSTGIQTCDRWNVRASNTDNLAITQAQSTEVPGYGFKFSYKYDTTTVESDLASDEKLAIEVRLEANTMQGLKFGTAQAEATTLGFWCKGSLTGVHGIYIRTHDGAQEFVQSYNIDTADTWEFKTINIPANTSKVINNDNGIGWWIQWGLAAGTGVDGATLGSWHDNATEVLPSNQVNYMANTAYEFLLTGVQLEIGTFDNNTMPAFPFESFASNLQRCQRYFTVINNNGRNGDAFFCGFTASSTAISGVGYSLATPLRIGNPTITKNSSVPMQRCTVDGFQTLTAGAGTIGLTAEAEDSYILCINLGGYSGMTSSRPAVVSFPAATNAVTIDAEL